MLFCYLALKSKGNRFLIAEPGLGQSEERPKQFPVPLIPGLLKGNIEFWKHSE